MARGARARYLAGLSAHPPSTSQPPSRPTAPSTGPAPTRAAAWTTHAVALVPLAMAAMVGDEAAGARTMRDLALGVTLGGDHAGTAPVPQWLVPWATLLPIGDLQWRAALGLALPASIAAAMLAVRGRRHPSAARGGAAEAMALGLGALGGAVLARVGPSTALVAIAIELSLAALVAGALERERALGWALAAATIGIWASPRLGWIALGPILLAHARSSRGAGALVRGAVVAAPIVVAAIAWIAVRSAVATTVLGRALRDGGWAAAPGDLLSAGTPARTALVVAVLAAIAFLGARWAGRLPDEDRAAGLTCALALGAGLVLRAQDAAALAVVVLIPVAGATLGALHLAVDRKVWRWLGHGRSLDGRATALRAAAWLVPALALGAAARAIEDDLRAHLRGNEPAAAVAMASLTTLGVAPPHAVLVVEDEPRLLRRLIDAAELGLRPDVRVLPVQALLLGGATRLAARTLDEVPGAADLLRGLIAHGTIEEPDASPVTAHASLLAALPAPRLRAIARHAEPSGGALTVSLERVEPSERRLHLVAIERRLRFVIDALSPLDAADPTRAMLREDATREARVLSAAGDREAAIAALHRAELLGAPPARIERWSARLRAKGSLDAEPPTEDEERPSP